MKPFTFSAAVFLSLLLACHTVCAQKQTTAKSKTNAAHTKFIGKWKGDEKCSDVSAPVALLYIRENGAEVLVSGIYSSVGEVRATVKGDTIFIPRQEVIDPNFTNLLVEGKLVFGIKPFNLSGKIEVQNNQKKDECEVKYYK